MKVVVGVVVAVELLVVVADVVPLVVCVEVVVPVVTVVVCVVLSWQLPPTKRTKKNEPAAPTGFALLDEKSLQ